MRKLSLVASGAAVALSFTLAACADPDSPAPTIPSGAQSSEEGETFDPSTIEEVADLAAMVPDSIRESGVLRNGASADYAPAEYRDGARLAGYNIEIVQALGRVLGLEGVTEHAEFAAIIPALGSKFDIGVSSLTITPEREEQVNMVSYMEAGSAFAVAKGNPSGFNPDDPCGFIVGVQTGTFQQELAEQMSLQCVDDGKEAIQVMPLDMQPDVVTKVVGGLWDASFADSPVISYTVANSRGELEQIGGIFDSEPQGVAIAKDDEQLTVAIQAAMQYLMDQGYLRDILANFGAQDAALDQARINPVN